MFTMIAMIVSAWAVQLQQKKKIGIPVAAVDGIGAGGSEGEVEDELADEMTASSRHTAF